MSIINFKPVFHLVHKVITYYAGMRLKIRTEKNPMMKTIASADLMYIRKY